jgi:hypothetical protein
MFVTVRIGAGDVLESVPEIAGDCISVIRRAPRYYVANPRAVFTGREVLFLLDYARSPSVGHGALAHGLGLLLAPSPALQLLPIC